MSDPVPVSAISTPGVTDVGPVGSNGTGGGKLLTAAEVRSFCSVYSTSQVDTLLSAKQDTLVSGTNIKTVNNTSLLGSGNITVSASPGGSSGQVQYNNAGAFAGSSSFNFDSSVGRITVPSATLAGNISTTAWTTSGVGLSHTTRTLTDTSSTGTVAAAYVNVLGANTVAASNSVTFTDCATLFVGNPSAGTNVTITNGLSMVTQGDVRIGGSIRLGSSTNGIYFSPTGNSQARISYFGSDFYIDNATAGGSTIFRVASGNSTALTITSGSVASFGGLVSVGTYTVGTLPSASSNGGRMAQVTDSSVTTNGSNVAGGGSSRVMVYSNGTNWKVVVA